MTRSVLFVCLGNICRSPTAEAVFRALAARAELPVLTDSCGTSDWHVGAPPYGPSITAAAVRGYDLSALRARQLSARDFNAFDLIVAMDRDNLRAIEAKRPRGNATPVALLLEETPDCGATDVPDPYYTRDFDGTLDLVEEACRALVARLAG
ncbi:MAG: low molecular weight protein-tyrosine-phosphatase [Paracoccaceae bacterium]